MMPYCESTTRNHALSVKHSEQLEKINDLFKNEGFKGKALFGQEIAINLDKIEAKLSRKDKREQRKTVDFAVGISDNGKNKQMLMVELKLNVSNPDGITKKDIEEKIKHSNDLLGTDPQIGKEKYILFQNCVKQQAKHYIGRVYVNRPSIHVLSPQEFKRKIIQ